MKEKTAGILGGMGPEATVDLMQRIIRLTPALDDIDHVRCIVDNNPKVPSRIKAIIEGTGDDPGPVMADMGKGLETAGADFLVIACNTAHHYYPAVADAVSIPVLNMVALVTDHIHDQFPDVQKAGLLASPAVNMTGLYAREFERFGLEDVWPDTDAQALLFDVIKRVKKGDTGANVRKDYQSVCSSLKNKGARVAIVACTELSALDEKLPLPFIDAAEILAQKIVDIAKHSNENHC